MPTFISFIGANDAGKLIANDDGAVLTTLNERQFDEIVLLYNSDGIVKNTRIAYKEIAEYIKKEIVKRKHCKENNIFLYELNFENVADHCSVYPVLLNFIQKHFPDISKRTIYAGISSGTPAMQTAWILFAEADVFPLKLLRAVEKRHIIDGKRVIEVDLLTDAKQQIEKLKNIERIIKPKGEYNPFVIANNTKLTDRQEKIVKSKNPILIIGETGTGKEILYKTILEVCKIEDSKQIALNCGAFSENLIESELFGHKRGAFTGAIYDKVGIVEVYQDGVIFLDEINSLPISIQVKLLRFLDSGEFRRVGETKIKTSNARIIAAANKSIAQMVSEGTFREDLYYRLRAIELKIPPLRENPKRIEQLIETLSEEIIPELILSKKAKNLLLNHKYRGNVRELKIILEQLKFLSKNNISGNDLSHILSQFQERWDYSEIEIPKELEGKAFTLVKKILANAALAETAGNAFKAAKKLGVTHPSIKKMANLECEPR